MRSTIWSKSDLSFFSHTTDIKIKELKSKVTIKSIYISCFLACPEKKINCVGKEGQFQHFPADTLHKVTR